MSTNTDYSRLRGYRIEIYPTDEQKEQIQKVISIYRAVYNIALGIQNDNRELGNPYIKYFDMCKLFSEMRNNNENYQWLNQVQLSTIRQALTDANDAFQNFFNKRTNYPRFKSRKRSKKFFTTRSERTHSVGHQIKIPEIGYIEAKNNPIPEGKRLYSTGVHFDGYRYWFYCQAETDVLYNENTIYSDPIGIDVGIRNMITTSDGEYYKYSDTSKYDKRLKRQQRRLQKYYNRYLRESLLTKTKYEDIPKSKNMQKKLHKRFETIQKISNKTKNDINCATKAIVEKYPSIIVIETIKVTNRISESPWLLKYKPQMMYYEIHRQLEYKAADRGIQIIKANPEFASSQICSHCGNIHKVYGNKVFKCPYCGLRIDRDLNAAINLRNLAYPETAYDYVA